MRDQGRPIGNTYYKKHLCNMESDFMPIRFLNATAVIEVLIAFSINFSGCNHKRIKEANMKEY